MGPKVEAIGRFAEAGGRIAAIGALEDAGEILGGRTGTSAFVDKGPSALPIDPAQAHRDESAEGAR